MKTRAALLALILAACLFFPARLPAEEYTNSLGMEFVLIGPGSFVMGSGQNADSDEGPPHQVEITRPFFLGKFEVTQAQYEALTHDNPSQFKNPDSPADSVTWEQAVSFIAALNKKEGTDAYRLPTEAEWEYAARGGTQGDFFFGDSSGLGGYAWFFDNSEGATHPVGQKEPNPFGLYDIYGNVHEWTQDLYQKDYYSKSPASDPQGPSSSMDQYRVLRGGCYSCAAFLCRSSFRTFYGQDASMEVFGFRVAFTQPAAAPAQE